MGTQSMMAFCCSYFKLRMQKNDLKHSMGELSMTIDLPMSVI
jgi:hypothetical protein